MTKIGTLAELNVKPGDVVEFVDGYLGMYPQYKGKRMVGRADGVSFDNGNGFCGGVLHIFLLISRAESTPKLWRDMTPEEKGALLLAHHDGKVIEIRIGSLEYGEWRETYYPEWLDHYAYRIKPKPKVETVHLMNFHELAKGHAIVFTVKDGEPDCTSIKMEKLQ